MIQGPVLSPGAEYPVRHKWIGHAVRVADPMAQKWPELRNRSAYKLIKRKEKQEFYSKNND